MTNTFTIKKIICFFLAVCMLIPVFGISADAAEAEKNVKIFGCTVPADAEKLCFYTASFDNWKTGGYPEDNYWEAMMRTNYDFDESECYPTPVGTMLDCAKIAEKLPGLKRLAIVGGKIKNAASLAKMKELTALELHDCGITDFSFLKTIGKNIRLLRFTGSPTYYDTIDVDISGMQYLTNIEEFFYRYCDGGLHTTGFDRIDLKKFPKMKDLTIYYRCFTDISFLSEMSGLTSLSIETGLYGEKCDYSPFKDLTKLKELDLSISGEADLSPLKALKSLEKLCLSDNGHKKPDTGFIKKLIKLKSLRLSFFDQKEAKKIISSLPRPEKLKSLWLQNGSISDLSFVQKLKNLEDVLLQGIKGKLDISPLKDLKKLKSLSLLRMQTDLSPILKLKSLESLSVSPCGDKETLEKFKKKYPDCKVYT